MMLMLKQTISRDIPLAEITLRKYEKPVKLEQRELVRKLCLSTGLLQPGDSRDIVVDILHALLIAKRDKHELSSEEVKTVIIRARKEGNLPVVGVADSNIRRQLKRLRDIYLVEKIKNRYRINEHDSLSNIFSERIEQYLLQNVLSRIRDYLGKIDERF